MTNDPGQTRGGNTPTPDDAEFIDWIARNTEPPSMSAEEYHRFRSDLDARIERSRISRSRLFAAGAIAAAAAIVLLFLLPSGDVAETTLAGATDSEVIEHEDPSAVGADHSTVATSDAAARDAVVHAGTRLDRLLLVELGLVEDSESSQDPTETSAGPLLRSETDLSLSDDEVVPARYLALTMLAPGL